MGGTGHGPRAAIPPLLRDSVPFRRFWLASSVSRVGDQVSTIALPLVAVPALDAGPAQTGYLAAAWLVPNLLLALPFGAGAVGGSGSVLFRFPSPVPRMRRLPDQVAA